MFNIKCVCVRVACATVCKFRYLNFNLKHRKKILTIDLLSFKKIFIFKTAFNSAIIPKFSFYFLLRENINK